MPEQPSLTEEYEQKALAAWKRWYHRAQPTIEDASAQAYVIARDTVGSLTTTQVTLLLQEHSDWTHRPAQETFDSDKNGVSIGEIARRHFVQYLERTIQSKGLQAACAHDEQTPTSLAKP